jgi:hypothetical protein
VHKKIGVTNRTQVVSIVFSHTFYASFGLNMQICIINHLYGGHSHNLVMLYDIYRFLCACMCVHACKRDRVRGFVKHELSFLSIFLVYANTRFFFYFSLCKKQLFIRKNFHFNSRIISFGHSSLSACHTPYFQPPMVLRDREEDEDKVDFT